MKQTLLGTGLSGLLGTRIIELLQNDYDFADLSYDTGVDITNREIVQKAIESSSAPTILHLAAKADVDSCEKDKALGKEGPAWKINVGGTQNIVDAAHNSGKQVIYISTDFVFDGTQEFYTEGDTPNPVNWYAQTKYEGEKIVLAKNSENLVVRIAYPYRAQNPIKKDFLHAIASRLSKKEKVTALTDHFFTPTFIDDIAFALVKLIQIKATGIYHVVGSSTLTPFEAAEEIARTFGYSTDHIVATTIAEFYAGRAPRPYKLSLKNDKIASLGVSLKALPEGLAAIQKQGFIV